MSLPAPSPSTVRIVVTGHKLLAGQVQASVNVVGAGGAGDVDITVINPGYAGNQYDIEIVDSGAGGNAITTAVVDGRTVVSVDLGGAALTCAALGAAIDGVVGAGVFQYVVNGVGATNLVVQDLQAFSGGEGLGLAVTLAGVACVVTGVDISASPVEELTISTPDLTGTAATGNLAKLRLRSNEKEDLTTVILA